MSTWNFENGIGVYNIAGRLERFSNILFTQPLHLGRIWHKVNF